MLALVDAQLDVRKFEGCVFQSSIFMIRSRMKCWRHFARPEKLRLFNDTYHLPRALLGSLNAIRYPSTKAQLNL